MVRTPSWRCRGPYAVLALLWGCRFLFIAIALCSFAPTQAAFGRILIGFVCLVVVLVVLVVRRGRVRISRAQWGAVRRSRLTCAAQADDAGSAGSAGGVRSAAGARSAVAPG